MLLRLLYIGWVLFLASPLCMSWTVLAEEPVAHDESSSSADSSEADSKVNEAKQKIVDARPPVAALGTLLQGIQPSMSNDKFSQLVDRTKGLSVPQKDALKNSFRSFSGGASESGEKAGQSFLKVVGGALAELDTTNTVNTQGPGTADGDEKSGEPKVPEAVKALQEQLQTQIKEAKEERQSQITRLRDALNRARDRESQRDGGKNGREGGEQSANGSAGTSGQSIPPPAGNESPDKGNSTALGLLSKALTGGNERGRNNGGGNIAGNSNPSPSNNEKQNSLAQREKERGQSSKSASESTVSPFANAAEEEEKEKKRQEAKKKSEEAAKAQLESPVDTAPMSSSGLILTGAKTPLSPLSSASGFGAVPGFGGVQGALDSAFSGGNVLTNSASANPSAGTFGGGSDLSSMRFDADSYAGPAAGLGKLGNGSGFGDGAGSIGGNSDAGGGQEVDSGVNSSADASRIRVPTPVFLGVAPIETELKGNILSRNVGKNVRMVCSENAEKIGVCWHPRAKSWLNRSLTGRTL